MLAHAVAARVGEGDAAVGVGDLVAVGLLEDDGVAVLPKKVMCVPVSEAAQMAAKSFGIEIASCAAGKKMGLCAEPAAKEVCALSCGECEAAQ